MANEERINAWLEFADLLYDTESSASKAAELIASVSEAGDAPDEVLLPIVRERAKEIGDVELLSRLIQADINPEFIEEPIDVLTSKNIIQKLDPLPPDITEKSVDNWKLASIAKLESEMQERPELEPYYYQIEDYIDKLGTSYLLTRGDTPNAKLFRSELEKQELEDEGWLESTVKGPARFANAFITGGLVDSIINPLEGVLESLIFAKNEKFGEDSLKFLPTEKGIDDFFDAVRRYRDDPATMETLSRIVPGMSGLSVPNKESIASQAGNIAGQVTGMIGQAVAVGSAAAPALIGASAFGAAFQEAREKVESVGGTIEQEREAAYSPEVIAGAALDTAFANLLFLKPLRNTPAGKNAGGYISRKLADTKTLLAGSLAKANYLPQSVKDNILRYGPKALDYLTSGVGEAGQEATQGALSDLATDRALGGNSIFKWDDVATRTEDAIGGFFGGMFGRGVVGRIKKATAYEGLDSTMEQVEPFDFRTSSEAEPLLLSSSTIIPKAKRDPAVLAAEAAEREAGEPPAAPQVEEAMDEYDEAVSSSTLPEVSPVSPPPPPESIIDVIIKAVREDETPDGPTSLASIVEPSAEVAPATPEEAPQEVGTVDDRARQADIARARIAQIQSKAAQILNKSREEKASKANISEYSRLSENENVQELLQTTDPERASQLVENVIGLAQTRLAEAKGASNLPKYIWRDLLRFQDSLRSSVAQDPTTTPEVTPWAAATSNLLEILKTSRARRKSLLSDDLPQADLAQGVVRRQGGLKAVKNYQSNKQSIKEAKEKLDIADSEGQVAPEFRRALELLSETEPAETKNNTGLSEKGLKVKKTLRRASNSMVAAPVIAERVVDVLNANPTSINLKNANQTLAPFGLQIEMGTSGYITVETASTFAQADPKEAAMEDLDIDELESQKIFNEAMGDFYAEQSSLNASDVFSREEDDDSSSGYQTGRGSVGGTRITSAASFQKSMARIARGDTAVLKQLSALDKFVADNVETLLVADVGLNLGKETIKAETREPKKRVIKEAPKKAERTEEDEKLLKQAKRDADYAVRKGLISAETKTSTKKKAKAKPSPEKKGTALGKLLKKAKKTKGKLRDLVGAYSGRFNVNDVSKDMTSDKILTVAKMVAKEPGELGGVIFPEEQRRMLRQANIKPGEAVAGRGVTMFDPETRSTITRLTSQNVARYESGAIQRLLAHEFLGEKISINDFRRKASQDPNIKEFLKKLPRRNRAELIKLIKLHTGKPNILMKDINEDGEFREEILPIAITEYILDPERFKSSFPNTFESVIKTVLALGPDTTAGKIFAAIEEVKKKGTLGAIMEEGAKATEAQVVIEKERSRLASAITGENVGRAIASAWRLIGNKLTVVDRKASKVMSHYNQMRLVARDISGEADNLLKKDDNGKVSTDPKVNDPKLVEFVEEVKKIVLEESDKAMKSTNNIARHITRFPGGSKLISNQLIANQGTVDRFLNGISERLKKLTIPDNLPPSANRLVQFIKKIAKSKKAVEDLKSHIREQLVAGDTYKTIAGARPDRGGRRQLALEILKGESSRLLFDGLGLKKASDYKKTKDNFNTWLSLRDVALTSKAAENDLLKGELAGNSSDTNIRIQDVNEAIKTMENLISNENIQFEAEFADKNESIQTKQERRKAIQETLERMAQAIGMFDYSQSPEVSGSSRLENLSKVIKSLTDTLFLQLEPMLETRGAFELSEQLTGMAASQGRSSYKGVRYLRQFLVAGASDRGSKINPFGSKTQAANLLAQFEATKVSVDELNNFERTSAFLAERLRNAINNAENSNILSPELAREMRFNAEYYAPNIVVDTIEQTGGVPKRVRQAEGAVNIGADPFVNLIERINNMRILAEDNDFMSQTARMFEAFEKSFPDKADPNYEKIMQEGDQIADEGGKGRLREATKKDVENEYNRLTARASDTYNKQYSYIKVFVPVMKEEDGKFIKKNVALRLVRVKDEGTTQSVLGSTDKKRSAVLALLSRLGLVSKLYSSYQTSVVFRETISGIQDASLAGLRNTKLSDNFLIDMSMRPAVLTYEIVKNTVAAYKLWRDQIRPSMKAETNEEFRQRQVLAREKNLEEVLSKPIGEFSDQEVIDIIIAHSAISNYTHNSFGDGSELDDARYLTDAQRKALVGYEAAFLETMDGTDIDEMTKLEWIKRLATTGVLKADAAIMSINSQLDSLVKFQAALREKKANPSRSFSSILNDVNDMVGNPAPTRRGELVTKYPAITIGFLFFGATLSGLRSAGRIGEKVLKADDYTARNIIAATVAGAILAKGADEILSALLAALYGDDEDEDVKKQAEQYAKDYQEYIKRIPKREYLRHHVVHTNSFVNKRTGEVSIVGDGKVMPNDDSWVSQYLIEPRSYAERYMISPAYALIEGILSDAQGSDIGSRAYNGIVEAFNYVGDIFTPSGNPFSNSVVNVIGSLFGRAPVNAEGRPLGTRTEQEAGGKENLKLALSDFALQLFSPFGLEQKKFSEIVNEKESFWDNKLIYLMTLPSKITIAINDKWQIRPLKTLEGIGLFMKGSSSGLYDEVKKSKAIIAREDLDFEAELPPNIRNYANRMRELDEIKRRNREAMKASGNDMILMSNSQNTRDLALFDQDINAFLEYSILKKLDVAMHPYLEMFKDSFRDDPESIKQKYVQDVLKVFDNQAKELMKTAEGAKKR